MRTTPARALLAGLLTLAIAAAACSASHAAAPAPSAVSPSSQPGSAGPTPSPSPQVRPVIMLTGDSVPLRLTRFLGRAATRFGWRVVSAAQGACPPSGEPRDNNGVVGPNSRRCPGVVGVQDRLIKRMHPAIVLWWDRFSLSDFLTPSGSLVVSGTPRFWRWRRQTLPRTVDRLDRAGAKVVFVATEPPGVGVWSRCHPTRCNPWTRWMIDHYRDGTSRWNSMMRHFAETHPSLAAFVSVTPAICHTNTVPCNDLIRGVPARADGTHYAGLGRGRVTAALFRLLAPIMKERVPPS